MSDELILGILGAIGAIGTLAGNIAVTWRTKLATDQATKAVAANTEATGGQKQATADLHATAEENQRMLREFMTEFREQAAQDRDASLATQLERLWQTREKVFLARHEEVTELMHLVLKQLSGGQLPPLSRSAPEAHATSVMPDLRTTLQQVPREKPS